jgi:heavy metal efflux system protein
MGQSIYPVIGFTLEGRNTGQVELRNSALYLIRPQFSMVPGIANVVVRGGKTKEFVITPHADKLITLGVTPRLISDAIGSSNFIESNGLLPEYRRLYLSLTDSRIQTLEELKNVVVVNDGLRTRSSRNLSGSMPTAGRQSSSTWSSSRG